MRKSQAGFTLIELVVVISIIAILAALALPRFVDITTDARNAELAGLRGGFGSAVQLVHAKWLAQGQTSPVALEGSSVAVTAAGWPDVDVAGGQSAAQLYGILMNTALPGGWAGSENAGETQATYTQPGTANTFVYDEATGAVN